MALARVDLEQWTECDAALRITRSFFADRVAYPDDAFFERRRGINKDIPEEYWPLVLLARALPAARALRLTAPGTAGPDGEIRLDDGSIVTVQVTSSAERGDGYLKRHQLRDSGLHATSVSDTAAIVEQRFSRIVEALREKEQNYHHGTAVLVIREESVSWGSELGPVLKARLAFERQRASHYNAIFITFNEDVWKLR